MPASAQARSIIATGHFDRHAQRLEHVGAAALRRERAVAVLRDPHAGAGREQCGGGRDVEGRRRPAARAAGVDELLGTVGGQAHHRAAQRRARRPRPRRPSRPSREGRRGARRSARPWPRRDMIAPNARPRLVGGERSADAMRRIASARRGRWLDGDGHAAADTRAISSMRVARARAASRRARSRGASRRTRSTSSSTNTPCMARLVRFTTPTSSSRGRRAGS